MSGAVKRAGQRQRDPCAMQTHLDSGIGRGQTRRTLIWSLCFSRLKNSNNNKHFWESSAGWDVRSRDTKRKACGQVTS